MKLCIARSSLPLAAFSPFYSSYLVDDAASFCATFYIIRETSAFTKAPPLLGRGAHHGNPKKAAAGECFQGKFVWRIEQFTRLKDLLKKRKITGLCIKSRRFAVGGRDCRLIVYPRGQSQPPNHLSMFLEVTDPRTGSADWCGRGETRLNLRRSQATLSLSLLSTARQSICVFSHLAADASRFDRPLSASAGRASSRTG